jgi:ornithine--oxo-acid transaminase
MGAGIAAVVVEPVQGEAGAIVPPPDYWPALREITARRGVLLIADEVQTGMGRTGRMFAVEHWDVVPDIVCLGKALGGGVMPVSAVVGSRAALGVFNPGDHGSTFGGNPLAAAVALEALNVIVDERLAERATALGARLLTGLASIRSPLVREVRGQGLLIGIEIDPRYATARLVVDRLLAHGILSKDTHGTVVRFAPPLVIAREEIDWAVAETRKVLEEIEREVKRAA